ncbi:putative short chain dehydrogenase [Scheffersomyces stipitis CBS 6054]|uniref:Putative short chain dehydrogenase n=1 Tax=Scheffersomyces stipitis (strain ATCC 58785 / CBS 6054 / NBRC 10063 / NRRL Y-11545) TaxID=322104 RepID=A3LPE1_PICST|nr:putative short chain dehydrogenase [Scheffersomyces stipitis CBS 6054]ABN64478.2 putative short chain dehydrogenase [Scheffersomyces stipitis CBS 6054]KAG2736100.1 hypothetical protein G9P44_000190 [Scheffersomyces stipitis]
MTTGKTYFISGANRGIGFELAKHYLEANPDNIVLATARYPDSATALSELGVKNSNLHILKLDVSDQASIATIDSQLKDITDGIDVLISNAGVSSIRGTILSTPAETWDRLLKVNTVGPILLFQALYPYLTKRVTKKVVFMSSLSGSIASFNPAYPIDSYGLSKTGLSFIAKAAGAELASEGFIVNAVHPGVVSTERATVYFDKIKAETNAEVAAYLDSLMITPQECATFLLKLIEELNEEKNGSFLNYDGQVLPY